MAGKQTFPKEEKLTNKRIIEELFKKGSSNFLYPFKIYSLPGDLQENNYPKVLITVPKKSFRKAVDRNRIKRQIREAYRKNKHDIFLNRKIPSPGYLGIIYVGKEKLEYRFIENKLISLICRLKNT